LAFVINKPENPAAVRDKGLGSQSPAPFLPKRLPPQFEWSALVPLIGRANAAIARYDELLEGLVNPDMLLTPLRTREAVLSSRIEGTWATLEKSWKRRRIPAWRPHRAVRRSEKSSTIGRQCG
jgi:hypothetical protein